MKRNWAVILVILILASLTVWDWREAGAVSPQPQVPDMAVITSPSNGQEVRGQVAIMGTATHPAFQFYKVEFSSEPPRGDESYAIIGSIYNQMVTNGQLAVWDTTQVPDGSYTLRLRVVRVDGNYSEARVVQIIVANTRPAEPTPSPTPSVEPTPTVTPTPLPPTPTIVIEQPALPTSPPATPTPTPKPLPTVASGPSGIQLDTGPLKTACLYGAGISIGVFLIFGFLIAFRNLVYALLGRRGS